MKLNNRGIGMIEVILAAGMLGGLALGVASLMENMNSGQNSGRFGIARLEMRTNVVSYLANNLRSCSCSLKDKTFNPGSLPATIALPDGLQIFATPATCSDPLRAVAKKELKIENAEVKSVDLVLKSGTGSMYTGELHIMMVASNMNNMERKVIIPMDVSTMVDGGDQKIIGCNAADSDQEVSFDDGPGGPAGDNIAPRSGVQTWTLSKVPSFARAVLIHFEIGREDTGRHDRRCIITNKKGQSFKIGHYSKGDGEAHMIAGSTGIPLGDPPHSLNVNCDNNTNDGTLRVNAVFQ